LSNAEASWRKSPARSQGTGKGRVSHRSARQTHFLSKGSVRVVVPPNNPIDAYTMAAIVRDAGLSIGQFKELL
jgi:hypothetical protein